MVDFTLPDELGPVIVGGLVPEEVTPVLKIVEEVKLIAGELGGTECVLLLPTLLGYV
jgi:hypothetical protein